MTNRVIAAWTVALGVALIAPVPAATAADVKEKAVETKDAIKEKAVEAKDAIKEKAQDVKESMTRKKAKTANDSKDAMYDTKNSVKEKAADTKESVKDKAVDAKDTVKEKAVEAKDKIKEKTHAATDKVKSKLHRDRGHDVMAGSDVRTAQTSLKAKGFDPGPLDGIYGPRTRAAIQDFQKAEGLSVTGRLDTETSARLASTSSTSYSGTPSASVTPSASPALATPTAGSRVNPDMAKEKDEPLPPKAAGQVTSKTRQAP